MVTPMSASLPNDDATLIHAAQAGDIAALGVLVQRHHASVRACIAVRLANSHDAEDLTQEVLLTAFRRLGDFDPTRPFGPWLRGIAINLVRNHLRKFRAVPVGLSEELQSLLDSQLQSHFQEIAEDAALESLRHCLDKLDGPSRALLHARYGEGHHLSALAEQLGRKLSAVSMQLHRLRTLLLQCVLLLLLIFGIQPDPRN